MHYLRCKFCEELVERQNKKPKPTCFDCKKKNQSKFYYTKKMKKNKAAVELGKKSQKLKREQMGEVDYKAYMKGIRANRDIPKVDNHPLIVSIGN